MSAEDNLSQQLFHGSQHPFKIGDVVHPRLGFAWASTTPEVASSYAGSETSQADEQDHPVLFGTVYKVKPLNSDLVRNPGADKRFGIYASPTGFSVTGIHSLVPNNRLGKNEPS